MVKNANFRPKILKFRQKMPNFRQKCSILANFRQKFTNFRQFWQVGARARGHWNGGNDGKPSKRRRRSEDAARPAAQHRGADLPGRAESV